jgi:hypothetical protein
VVVFVVVALSQQNRKATLERVAQRFRGRMEGGDLFTPPQVRLRFQNYPAVLKYTSHGKRGQHTHFTITWPDPSLRCELYPQNLMSELRKLWGMEDIEIGSPQFDAAYFISGNSRQAVRELLSRDVQVAVFRLSDLAAGRSFGRGRDLHVDWQRGVLTVTKTIGLTTYEDLEQFVTLSAELFQAALATRATGITFLGEAKQAAGELAEPPEPDAAESQCHVCGEPLAKDLVWCAGCQTPHHRECWEYFGSCSTYGCGQKRYVTKTRRRKAS